MESLFASLSPLIFQTVAITVTALLLPKLKITSIFGALGMVIALSLLNQQLWSSDLFGYVPDAFSLKSMILLVCNGFIFFLLAKFLPGIEVEGLLTALLAPILFSIFTILAQQYLPLVDWAAVWEGTSNIIVNIKSFVLSSPEKT